MKAKTQNKEIKIRPEASRADEFTASKPMLLDLKLWLKFKGRYQSNEWKNERLLVLTCTWNA